MSLDPAQIKNKTHAKTFDVVRLCHTSILFNV